MSRFCPLFSSSSGNSVYVSGGGTALLVDAGVSCRRLLAALDDRSLDPAGIQGILITHEHSDHISGLEVLLKKLRVHVYASPATLDCLCRGDKVPPGTVLVEAAGSFTVGDIRVTAFDTPHDAGHSLGFRLEMPDQRVIVAEADENAFAVRAGI